MRDVEDRSILSLASGNADRQIRYGDDALHIADFWMSRTALSRGLLILVHGGFWRPAYDRAHLGPMANALADSGYDVASIEYRRVPGAPDSTTQDVRLACERIPELLEFDGRSVVIGHSAGGHLALWYAAIATAQPVGIVALAPVASLTLAESRELDGDAVRSFLGTRAATRNDLDPCELGTPRAAVTIVHGTADALVPIELSQDYQRKHPQTRLAALDDVGHFALIDPRSQAWRTVLTEIGALLA